jgi:hypothetical protein
MRNFVLFLAAALSSGTALAQSQPGGTSETGTLVNRRAAQIHGESRVDARLTMKQFGDCSVARAPYASLQLVNMPVDASGYEKQLDRVISDDCLSTGELSIPATVARGAIFEALYRKEFAAEPPLNLKDLPAYDYSAGYSRPFSAEAGNVIGLAVVGDCVARTSPIAAHELLVSVPGTAVEDRNVAVVARTLPGCIPPKQTFKFSRSVIRSSVAEGMYRLASILREQRRALKKASQ